MSRRGVMSTFPPTLDAAASCFLISAFCRRSWSMSFSTWQSLISVSLLAPSHSTLWSCLWYSEHTKSICHHQSVRKTRTSNKSRPTYSPSPTKKYWKWALIPTIAHTTYIIAMRTDGYGIMSSVQICKALTDRWSVVEAYSILDSAKSVERARILQSLCQLTDRIYDHLRPFMYVLRTSLIRKLMFANSFLRMCSNSPLSLMSEDIVIINTE